MSELVKVKEYLDRLYILARYSCEDMTDLKDVEQLACLVRDYCEKVTQDLQDRVMLNCPVCGESYLNPAGVELYDKLSDYESRIESVKEYVKSTPFILDSIKEDILNLCENGKECKNA